MTWRDACKGADCVTQVSRDEGAFATLVRHSWLGEIDRLSLDDIELRDGNEWRGKAEKAAGEMLARAHATRLSVDVHRKGVLIGRTRAWMVLT